MAIFATPYESPAEYQWDPDSYPEQPRNCGPTSATKVAVFFRDDPSFGIQKTRLLGSSRIGTGTNATEQKRMLEARGIPASIYVWTPAQIRTALATGRRPIILWMKMGAVPLAIRINAFDGAHALSGLGLGRAMCLVHHVVEDGIWILDPNFHRDRAVHPEKVFYPDHAWAAGSAAIGRYVIVPDKPKLLPVIVAPPLPAPAPAPTPVIVKPAPVIVPVKPAPPPPPPTRIAFVSNKRIIAPTGLNVRERPTVTARIVGHVPYNAIKTTRQLERSGGWYKVGATGHHDWVSVVVNGHLGWIANGWTRPA